MLSQPESFRLFHLYQNYIPAEGEDKTKDKGKSDLGDVHEAGSCCGNQSQSFDGAVDELRENVTRCFCGLSATVHLVLGHNMY